MGIAIEAAFGLRGAAPKGLRKRPPFLMEGGKRLVYSAAEAEDAKRMKMGKPKSKIAGRKAD